MQLTAEEQAMLRGDQGIAVKEAIEYLIKVGEFLGAERLVPVTNVHMMGDIEVMGDGGLDAGSSARRENGARCAVADHDQRALLRLRLRRALGQDPGEAAKERELIGLLRAMDVRHHRHLHQLPDAVPAASRRARRLGRHRHRDLRQLGVRRALELRSRARRACGRHHRAHARIRLSSRRAPQRHFLGRAGRASSTISPTGARSASWSARRIRATYAVPVFTGVKRPPTADELKHLGAALASYGSMAMFHMVGVTPEAPTLEAALGGNRRTTR